MISKALHFVAAALAVLAGAWLAETLLPGAGVLLAVSFPVIARSGIDLQEMANPPAGKGVSEAVPWMFYDTETYTDNVTTTLNFFRTTKTGIGASNMRLAGQLPAPEYFEVYFVGLDVLAPPAAAAATPVEWNDVWQILFGSGAAGTGGPTWNFIMSGKEYGPFPLSTLHGTGGLHGSGGGVAAGPLGGLHQTNSVPDGGFCVAGAIMIPPTVGFVINVVWPVAVNISANRDLRINMLGTLHRRVL